jgi:hypothetical protein
MRRRTAQAAKKERAKRKREIVHQSRVAVKPTKKKSSRAAS